MLNYMSPINNYGFGIASVNLLDALVNSGTQVAALPLGGIDEPMEHHRNSVRQALLQGQKFFYDAPCLRVYHQFSMKEFIGRGKRCGMTFFERDQLTTDEVYQLNYLDEIFSPTKWAKKVMEDSGVTVPIHIANCGVDTQVFNNKVKPAQLKKATPNTTVFVNIGKWSINKASDAILNIFNTAFSAKDDILLIMACFNPIVVPGFDGPKESKRWENMYMNSKLGLAGKIRVIPGRLQSQHEIASLIAGSDVGFFPARGEGWNMGLTECLSMGKQCIATDYSAHTEYSKQANVAPINITKLEEVYDPPFFLADSGNWAFLGQEQLDQAVHELRQHHDLKQSGNLKFNEDGFKLFRDVMTWQNCAKKIKEVIGI